MQHRKHTLSKVPRSHKTDRAINVSIYFSDFFDVAVDVIENYGAFNISLVNDLPLFIDPFLLFTSGNQEYQTLHQEIIRYVRFLREKSLNSGISQGLLKSWYYFPEVKQTWLGYSNIGNQGRGLGDDFAKALSENLHSVFTNFGQEQITQGSHLEKLCLIKDGVGKDNISDFTTNLIKGFLLQYTQKFTIQHISPELRKMISVPKVQFNYETMTWEHGLFDLPYYMNDYVLLTPKDILTKIDIWINRTDLVERFEEIAQSVPNEQLRAELNNYLLFKLTDNKSKKKPTKEEIAKKFLSLVHQYPEILDYYIRDKELSGDEARSVSHERVVEVEQVFIDHVVSLVDELLTETSFYQEGNDTYRETHQRLAFFKDVIENKGGHHVLYFDGQPLKKEKDVQILFRLVWFATVSDVSREVNDGRGPVDFKISRGNHDKTLVEFKLASNTQLRRNLEKQTPIYEKASDAQVSIKAIVYFTASELEKVQTILRDLKLIDHPDVVLIDARMDNKPSGSKA